MDMQKFQDNFQEYYYDRKNDDDGCYVFYYGVPIKTKKTICFLPMMCNCCT
jgi:hypothetical protein